MSSVQSYASSASALSAMAQSASRGSADAAELVLQRAVDAVLVEADSAGGPAARARAHARLLTLLQDQVLHVAAVRDAALAELVLARPAASNRALAAELNISRQRVDQLKRHVRAGGRRQRR